MFHNDLINGRDENIFGREAREFEEEDTDDGHLDWAYHDLGMANLGVSSYDLAIEQYDKAIKN